MTKLSFTIYATDSRLSKGLLAIPRKFSEEFPSTKGKVLVVFDDGTKVEPKIYVPYDPKIKECRLFGLSRWFSRRAVVAGDAITITIEDPKNRVYRLALNRFVEERRAVEARRLLYTATSDDIAVTQLRTLAESRRRKPQDIALEEIALLAQRPVAKRKRAMMLHRGRAEAVPPPLRALLEAIHSGKCQICGFTFQKRDGRPYFEIHHIEPDQGHHPMNMLVICPNCHAQLENATVSDMERTMGWVVSLRINGKRFRVRQPFTPRRLPAVVAALATLCIAARVVANVRII